MHANSEQSTRQEANQQHIHTYTNAHTPNKTTQPNRGPAETPPRRGPAPTREERPRRRDPTRRKGGREDPTGRRDTSPEPREPPPSATQTAQAGPVPDHPKLQPHGGDATSAENHPKEAQVPTPKPRQRRPRNPPRGTGKEGPRRQLLKADVGKKLVRGRGQPSKDRLTHEARFQRSAGTNLPRNPPAQRHRQALHGVDEEGAPADGPRLRGRRGETAEEPPGGRTGAPVRLVRERDEDTGARSRARILAALRSLGGARRRPALGSGAQ